MSNCAVLDSQELDNLKGRLLIQLKAAGLDNPYPKITCDECNNKNKCNESYDLYNIDGDCLAMK